MIPHNDVEVAYEGKKKLPGLFINLFWQLTLPYTAQTLKTLAVWH